VKCVEGYNVDQSQPSGSQCLPCHRFDPRCRTCDNTGCTSCMDLVLTSVRRSGARSYDPLLPEDEQRREFSQTVPFNSMQTTSFDEAERFKLYESESYPMLPLKDHSVSCKQGNHNDVQWNCTL